MDYSKVLEAAQGYQKDMTAFLRDMIKIPSESCEEELVIKRIAEEMEKVGFDKVQIDAQGNCLGFLGHGSRLIAFDGHIDTVGVGLRDNWEFDPYEGFETETLIGGRGGSDQEGGIASAIYAAKIMNDLGLLPDDVTILVTATVQEEDCDGLCWQFIHKEDGVTPEFVVSTEPTDGGIYRGHRGRMEIRVDMHGVSCHGSAPERGSNAIEKMAEVICNVKALNENDDADETEIKGLIKMLNPKYNPDHYEDARFLGKGTCTVSQIYFTSPSRCAVADSCQISVDRRMTAGETFESCLEEIRQLPACQKYKDDVTVSMYKYDRPSYTDLVYETDCYFPTWINKETAPHVKAITDAYHALFGEKRIGAPESMDKRDRPLVDKWTFSTNCVSIQGRYGIPCVGFGPGAESQAHAPNEVTYKQDLVTCAALLSALPMTYVEQNPEAVK
ncbi:MAG: YgeY family selenium metabolism-linked hydrolase [Lachnospiraceae bacterium]|nr:YgeY family selenium metabolism-linked hydrolase [Lachnospiraceae bacterium]